MMGLEGWDACREAGSEDDVKDGGHRLKRQEHDAAAYEVVHRATG